MAAFETRDYDDARGGSQSVTPACRSMSSTRSVKSRSPSPAPTAYTYRISVNPQSGGNDLWRYSMPSTKTSVVYNVDGTGTRLQRADHFVYRNVTVAQNVVDLIENNQIVPARQDLFGGNSPCITPERS